MIKIRQAGIENDSVSTKYFLSFCLGQPGFSFTHESLPPFTKIISLCYDLFSTSPFHFSLLPNPLPTPHPTPSPSNPPTHRHLSLLFCELDRLYSAILRSPRDIFSLFVWGSLSNIWEENMMVHSLGAVLEIFIWI